jgi:hypothetical protein
VKATSAVLGAGLAAWAIAGPALSQEPVGCDKFKWPLDKERATMNGADLPKVVSGAAVPFPIPFAAIVALKPFADAKLPTPPTQPPQSAETFAGFFDVPAPKKPGSYKITLSTEGWVDVEQSGQTLKSTAFSGAVACAGVRKSVKFDLAATPFTVELSGVKVDSINLAISGD